jgi:RND family efflux transporter MFP subunit
MGKTARLRSLLAAALLAAFAVSALAQAPAAPTPGSSLTLPAQILPYQSAILTAKVAGYLRSIRVDKGDTVRTGELIADIEVPELVADQAQFKAEVDVAQAQYDRVQGAIQKAPDLVTPQSVDEAHGKLQVAKAQLERVETLLRYARITAPFSGTIVARYVDPGAYIPVASNSTQQNAAVVSLMDFSKVRIQVPVPATDAAHISRGTPALITVKGLAGKKIASSVTRVSYAVDQASQTMLAEIELPNPGGVLRPGMYVTVQLSVKP